METKSNVGGIDRVIRLIIAIALMGAGFWYQSWWGAVGLIPLVTAIWGRCLVYFPLGISTCKDDGGCCG